MRKIANRAELLWEVQDLREQLLLAQAEQVKVERLIREVVQDPRNRGGLLGYGPVPLYADPAHALDALRKLGALPYLVRPGSKRSRVKPEVLAQMHGEAAAEVRGLQNSLKELEGELSEAGMEV